MLVLWSENLKIDSLEILKDPKIKRIAMANPKLAPYGKASMEVLDHLKLTSSLKSKIVYGASISQAHQFVATKNAQIGFGALSLIDKKDKNISYFIIDKALYSPIEQVLIATKNGANNPLAKVFKDFLFSPKARAIFKEYGYIVDKNASKRRTMDHEFLITMRLSFSLAFITTLILLPIGIFLGYSLSLKRNLLTNLTETLVYMPLVLPPSVLGFYLLLIFSPSSFLGAFLQDALNVKLVFSFQGLILGSVIFSLPFFCPTP